MLQIRLPNIFDRVRYLARISNKILTIRFVKKLFSPLYRHEIGHITLRDRDSFSYDRYVDDKNTESVVINTESGLKVWEGGMSKLIPLKSLLRHLSENQHNIVR